MPRDLPTALDERPLFFEPVPPTARASPARSAAHTTEVVEVLTATPRIDAVNVPELVDENHDGRPYYRSGDTRLFAHHLLERTQRETIINKVVAHLANPEALEQWARATVERGVHHLVLVGGSSRYIPYPGPPVAEANRICAPILEAAGGRLGNIAIPQRVGEAHRMLQKTRSGARFFTTQILFGSESALRMLHEYDQLCRKRGVDPASVLLSVAPIADEGDAEFVRWLGADIPEAAERSILNGDETGAGARSIARALGVWHEVQAGALAHRLTVPIGVNVEQISQRHLATAAEMIRAFATEIDRPAGS